MATIKNKKVPFKKIIKNIKSRSIQRDFLKKASLILKEYNRKEFKLFFKNRADTTSGEYTEKNIRVYTGFKLKRYLVESILFST